MNTYSNKKISPVFNTIWILFIAITASYGLNLTPFDNLKKANDHYPNHQNFNEILIESPYVNPKWFVSNFNITQAKNELKFLIDKKIELHKNNSKSINSEEEIQLYILDSIIRNDQKIPYLIDKILNHHRLTISSIEMSNYACCEPGPWFSLGCSASCGSSGTETFIRFFPDRCEEVVGGQPIEVTCPPAGTTIKRDPCYNCTPCTNSTAYNISGKRKTICEGDTVDLSSLILGVPENDLEYKAIGEEYNSMKLVAPTETTLYIARDSNTATMCVDTALITITVQACSTEEINVDNCDPCELNPTVQCLCEPGPWIPLPCPAPCESFGTQTFYRVYPSTYEFVHPDLGLLSGTCPPHPPGANFRFEPCFNPTPCGPDDLVSEKEPIDKSLNPEATISISQNETCFGSPSPSFQIMGTPHAIVTYHTNGGPNELIDLDENGEASITASKSGTQTITLLSVNLNENSQTITDQSATHIIYQLGISPSVIYANGQFNITGPAGGTLTYNIDNGADQEVELDFSGQAFVDANVDETIYLTQITAGCPFCSTDLDINLKAEIPCNISISNVTKTDKSCAAANDGTITVTASCTSCTESIEYSLNGTDWLENNGVFTGLDDGTYTAQIREKNNEECNSIHSSSTTLLVGSDNLAPVPNTTWNEILASGSSFQSPHEKGYSVAISGDYAMIGVPGYNQGSQLPYGSVIFLHKNGDNWSIQRIEYGPVLGEDFGRSVAISSEYAFVGAPLRDVYVDGVEPAQYYRDDLEEGSTLYHDAGSVYVYKRNGLVWSHHATLESNDPRANGNFGLTVGISGNKAIIGAPTTNVDIVGGPVGLKANDVKKSVTSVSNGFAYIFHENGGSWSLQEQLSVNNVLEDFRFGQSVAISGDFAVVGTMQNPSINEIPFFKEDKNGVTKSNSSNIQPVFIYHHDQGTWSPHDTIMASDDANGRRFGHAVSISGDRIIVGAPKNSDELLDGGEIEELYKGDLNKDLDPIVNGGAYIFNRNGNKWEEEAILTASDASSFDEFGASVAISSGFALVGAPGSNSILFLNESSEFQKDLSSEQNGGKVYSFKLSDDSWQEEQVLRPTSSNVFDRFGFAVALSTETAIIGAPNQMAVTEGEEGEGGEEEEQNFSHVQSQNNELFGSPGAAYLFERSTQLPDITGECGDNITPTAPSATDNCTNGTITGTTNTAFPINAIGNKQKLPGPLQMRPIICQH